MSNVNNISQDLLIKTIKEILVSADLNVMTPKLVRHELQIRLNVGELSSRKKEINQIIMKVIDGFNTKDNNNNSNSKKSSTVVTNNTETDLKKSSDSKAIDKKSDIESSDSSSDESIGDEELARKLQNEELDSKQRVTRSVKSNKSHKNKSKKTINKSTKKRKQVDSDASEEDKPQKKKKMNGYLKPCILSPELANFLGELEMPRHEVVKRIWSYVKEKNLLDPKNKQFAICDNELLKIFGNRKRFRLFGMMKHLTKHLE